MNHLRENIAHYMEMKQIKLYTHLLIAIAHELGIRGEQAYKFALKEKANFCKMLNGERNLKFEYIIPLEKIFGVPLARLVDEEAYKLPADKYNVPYDKGFRYYAYLDDPLLYKKCLDNRLCIEGNSILSNTDEFNKTFLDYLVEYNSINGVYYLYNEYGLKLKWSENVFVLTKNGNEISMRYRSSVEFARLVASAKDVKLFYDIYDTHHILSYSNNTVSYDSIFNDYDFIEIIMNDKDLFKQLFVSSNIERKINRLIKRKTGRESYSYDAINPIINKCLTHALLHVDKYKSQAIKILKFGIEYNKLIADSIDMNEWHIYNALGELYNEKLDRFYKPIVFISSKIGYIEDIELHDLAYELIKFNNPKRY